MLSEITQSKLGLQSYSSSWFWRPLGPYDADASDTSSWGAHVWEGDSQPVEPEPAGGYYSGWHCHRPEQAAGSSQSEAARFKCSYTSNQVKYFEHVRYSDGEVQLGPFFQVHWQCKRSHWPYDLNNGPKTIVGIRDVPVIQIHLWKHWMIYRCGIQILEQSLVHLTLSVQPFCAPPNNKICCI